MDRGGQATLLLWNTKWNWFKTTLSTKFVFSLLCSFPNNLWIKATRKTNVQKVDLHVYMYSIVLRLRSGFLYNKCEWCGDSARCDLTTTCTVGWYGHYRLIGRSLRDINVTLQRCMHVCDLQEGTSTANNRMSLGRCHILLPAVSMRRYKYFWTWFIFRTNFPPNPIDCYPTQCPLLLLSK